MSNSAQSRATRNYRARLSRRGFTRFEIMALETDRDLFRSLARRLADTARTRVRDFDVERTIEKTENLYRRLLAEHDAR